MANRANIPRHELIRTPQGWKDQERALVVQLERIHDDIYKRFPQIESEISSLSDGLSTLAETQQTMPKLAYRDYQATTGTSLYQGVYYADIVNIETSTYGEIVGVYVLASASNIPAFAYRLSNANNMARIRICTMTASIECVVRVLFMK